MSAEAIDRLAELAVRFGANVQRGQIVAIGTEPGKEELTRALAVHAYKAGARFVDVASFDLHIKRARILHAEEDTLDYVPPWYGERLLALGDERAARIGLTGPVAPGLLNDLDPARAGRDQLPFLKEAAKVVNERTTNWTAIPCPTPAWAQLVFPDLGEAEALERLWQEILHVLRLDEDDPVARWRERADTLVGAAERLTERRFDALHFTGPGHRPARRAAADVELDGGALLDRGRHRAHAEPPDRGGLHDARPAARRRHRRVDEAARGRRDDRARPARALRGRQGGRDRRRRERGRPAPVLRARPRRVAARRGRARRRRGPHRPARHGLLRHAARRERRLAHRAGLGVRVHGGRGRTSATSTSPPCTSTS